MVRGLTLVLALVAVLCGAAGVRGDVPAHCLYNQALGTWTLSLGPNTGNSSIDCSGFQASGASSTLTVTLAEPDVATCAGKANGFWTLIYDQGFELVLDGTKYFAYFDWTEQADGTVVSHCDRVRPFKYHEAPATAGVLPTAWGCWSGTKAASSQQQQRRSTATTAMTTATATPPIPEGTVTEDSDLAARINAAQSSWTASPRSHFHGLTHAEAQQYRGKARAGAPFSLTDAAVHAASASGRSTDAAPRLRGVDALPASIDYRNVSGTDYTFMRDQLNCGSCYAFAATEMLSQRTRIRSQNTIREIYGVQDVLSCSDYAQGCDGGFPYLVSKYGEDYGIALEQCFGYYSGIMAWVDAVPCHWKCNDSSLLRGATNYHYVGGYFGGTTEAQMKQELVDNGPLAVGFEVLPDFEHYTGGVYVHTNQSSNVNPFTPTNHAVLLVGYGYDTNVGLPFWVVQNSWGRHFGETGFFRIVRGRNEVGIESMAVGADPVAKVVGPPLPNTPEPAPVWAIVTIAVTGSVLVLTWVLIGVQWYRTKRSPFDFHREQRASLLTNE